MSTWNGLPVEIGQRQKWTAVSQGTALAFQGVTLSRPIGKTDFPPHAVLAVIGRPYYDDRVPIGQPKSLATFEIESWAPGSPTDYLTYPATGLPSGITLAGAFLAVTLAIEEAAAGGEDLSAVGATQVQTQTALEQERASQGLPMGPGPGAVTEEVRRELAMFEQAEAERLAEERQAIANGATPAAEPATMSTADTLAVVGVGLAALKLLGVI